MPQDDRSDIIKPVALTHPPPPPHPHPYSTGPSTGPYNKAPKPYGGCGNGREYPTSQSPFAPFIPSPSSAFTPASSHSSPPLPPPPPPASYPSSSSSSSSPPVLVPPQPSVYNTPINLYSTENACEVAMGQRRGLLESQGGALPLQLNGWVMSPQPIKQINQLPPVYLPPTFSLGSLLAINCQIDLFLSVNFGCDFSLTGSYNFRHFELQISAVANSFS